MKHKLLLEEPNDVVAESTIYQTSSGLFHKVFIGLDVYRINVHSIYLGMENIQLPILTEELSVIGNVMSTFIAWSKHFVLFSKVKCTIMYIFL